MKNKVLKTALAALTTAAILSGSAFASETPAGGVEVVASEDSATGYTANFTYFNEEATNVRLTGSFYFYVKDDVRFFGAGYLMDRLQGYNSGIAPTADKRLNSPSAWFVSPDEWRKDANLRHISDSDYSEDMVLDETTGAWTASLNLPCASYLYQYAVSYDNGETWESITDPANTPSVNDLGAMQSRSQFFVPYDAEKQAPEDDWTWLFPAEDESIRGDVTFMTYDGVISDESPLMVYTPAHYDANREEPYKVLYLSHGGGGEVADWFHQANVANIMDHLVADNACEEFLLVTMDNQVYKWDYDQIYENVVNHIIPFVEEHYNVSTESEDRAFAGLSMGGRTAVQMLYHDPLLFSYLGIWSAAEPNSCPQLDDYSDYHYPNLHLAAGFADPWLVMGYPEHPDSFYKAEADQTIMGMADKFDELGLTYNDGKGIYIVDGSHDWFNWPQVFREYVTNVLWKA